MMASDLPAPQPPHVQSQPNPPATSTAPAFKQEDSDDETFVSRAQINRATSHPGSTSASRTSDKIDSRNDSSEDDIQVSKKRKKVRPSLQSEDEEDDRPSLATPSPSEDKVKAKPQSSSVASKPSAAPKLNRKPVPASNVRKTQPPAKGLESQTRDAVGATSAGSSASLSTSSSGSSSGSSGSSSDSSSSSSGSDSDTQPLKGAPKLGNRRLPPVKRSTTKATTKARAKSPSTPRSSGHSSPKKDQKSKLRGSGESSESGSDSGSDSGQLTLARYRDKKSILVAEVLRRWWYVLPQWPPPDFDPSERLKELKLRPVPIEDWEIAKDVDENGFTKCYALSQFKGIFRDANGKAHDARPVEGKPCHANFIRLSDLELYRYLVTALENQMIALDKSIYDEATARKSLKKELSYAKSEMARLEKRFQSRR
eukprot:GHVN01053280.1.p1 GENE.GHVN01053280.1~~GHVN01053280.1.p1  ORF type:complete len:426 (+),score=97.30 GHVN01053280.1:137-1414(+)